MQWAEPDTDEFLNEWEEHEEADFDPLDSPRELLGSCLSIIVCDRHLPLYLRRLTSVNISANIQCTNSLVW